MNENNQATTFEQLEARIAYLSRENADLRVEIARLTAQVEEAQHVIDGLVLSLDHGTLNGALVMAAIHGVSEPDEVLVDLATRARAWLAANSEEKTITAF
jgi:prefoldin subunit 5